MLLNTKKYFTQLLIKGILFFFVAFSLPACLGDDDHIAACLEGTSETCPDDDHGNNDHDETDHETDLATEACEHFEGGPFVAVTAVSDVTDAAIGTITNDHKSYQVSLTENTTTSEFYGFVEFTASEAVEYVFFFSKTVEVTFWQSDAETKIEPEEIIEGSEGCELIGVQYHIALPVGSVYLEFAPSNIEAVDIVIEAVGAEHEHEHEE